MTVVVTGGSGFIGTELTKALLAKGDTVIVIDTRGPRLTHPNLFFIPCDLEKTTLPFNVLERTDAIINLAGNSLFRRWTSTVRSAIERSRIEATAHLIESLQQTTNKPSIFISASSTAFYGDGGDRELDERSAQGETFLSGIIERWEKKALSAEAFGCRVVIVRSAPVIGRGGFFLTLMKAARFHLMFRIQKEDFWMPWVHISDIVRVYLFALETNTLQGVVNAAAPLPITQSDIIRAAGKVSHSLSVGVLPFRRLFFGESVKEVFINQKVLPQLLIDKGFAFSYSNIREAVADIFHAKK